MTTPYRLYMDDSGNVDPVATNALEIRYGSIIGVLFESKYLEETFNPSFEAIVTKHFGTNADGSPLVLHRRRLNKPPDHGPYSILHDAGKKAAWNAEALSMYRRAKYTVISACVDKVGWYWKYPEWSGDFYEVLVQAVLERSYYFLSRRKGIAEVNVETKGNRDQRIKEHYRHALVHGFDYISADKLRTVFTSKELNIIKKENCNPGGQMADLLAGPALQHIRHLHTGRHPVTSPFTQELCGILENDKYYREWWGGPSGFGRLWRPKT
jgi:hypothetical protein